MSRLAPSVVFALLAFVVVGVWLWARSSDVPAAPPSGRVDAATNHDLHAANTAVAMAETAASAPVSERTEAIAAPAERRGFLRLHARWPDATSASGVRVRLAHAPGGRPVATDPLARDYVTTDDEGVAIFRALAPGVWQVETARGDRQTIAVTAGVCDVEIVLEDGVAIVGKGRTIRGVVRYRDGGPMVGAFVSIDTGHDELRTIGRVRSDGGFEFCNLDDALFSLHVQYPLGSPPDAAPLERSGLRPDGRMLELTAQFDQPLAQANGTVLGRIDDAGSRITGAATARVVLVSDQRWSRSDDGLENGAFRFDDVTPGRMRLALMQGNTTLATGDWFELLPGAMLDIGVLRTAPGGAVHIRVTRGAGCEGFEPTFHLRRSGASGRTVVALGTQDAVDVPNLTPGDYTVSGHARGMAAIHESVTVTGGGVTELALSMARGALVQFEAWLPDGTHPSKFTFEIRDADGRVVHRDAGDWNARPTRPVLETAQLAAGAYTVDLQIDDLVATAPFTVGQELEHVAVSLQPKRR